MVDSPQPLDPVEDSDMTPKQAAEHLRIIRELMERPIRQTTRSGLSGIVAGLLALAGCAGTWALLEWQPPGKRLMAVGLWLGVLAAAGAADLLLTWRRARGLGQTYWRRAQGQTALAIAPGFLFGGLASALLYQHEAFAYIPFAWMVFYGMALWSVGLFSVVEVKLLGAAFMGAGIIGGAFLTPWALPAMAATFGGFHLIYGVVVYVRHGG